jgi:Tol biopolymer transport system component
MEECHENDERREKKRTWFRPQAGEKTILADTGGNNGVETVAWSPDGKHLAVVRFDWTVGKDGKWSSNMMGDTNFRIEFMDAAGRNRSLLELEDEQFLAVSGLDWR